MQNSFKKSKVMLSRDEREELNEVDISNRVCVNSKSKYQCGVNRFLRYCEERNLSPFPTETNLSHFVSEISREIQPSSVNGYLTGISHHFSSSYPQVLTNRMSIKVRNTVKGCQKSFSKSVKRANAMELSDLDVAASFFKLSFDDLLFNTIMAMGFNGLHRIGELVEPDKLSLKDDRKLIKRWSLKIDEENYYVTYDLPSSKTDTHFSGVPVMIPERPGIKNCPYRTIVKYAAIRDSAFPTNPFLLLRSNGYIPTRSWFMKRLQQVFGDTRSGHSLRAGGATAYARSGVRMEVIQRMGRWKSDAFESYIHGHPLLNLLAAQQNAPFAVKDLGVAKPSSSNLPGKLNRPIEILIRALKHSRDRD